MSDAYYTYAANPMQHQQPPQQQPTSQSLVGKRPRSDYDAPPGQELSAYYSREDDRASQRQMINTESINPPYNHYLHSANPYPGGSHLVDDPRIIADHRIVNDPRFGNDPRMINDPRIAGDHRIVTDPHMGSLMNPGVPVKGHGSNHGSGRPEASLPPDATNTLYVEGLPPNCSRREVAHIFRPFVGYKEVRLVTKESRRPGGDPLVLCFVDFVSPAHAATALNALQGYTFDEIDRDSASLRLQYSRFPGARSGGGGRRGKR